MVLSRLHVRYSTQAAGSVYPWLMVDLSTTLTHPAPTLMPSELHLLIPEHHQVETSPLAKTSAAFGDTMQAQHTLEYVADLYSSCYR